MSSVARIGIQPRSTGTAKRSSESGLKERAREKTYGKPRPSVHVTFLICAVLFLTKVRQIFLATKFGNHVSADGGREIRNDPAYIRQAVRESLQRLKTDYIDLLYWYVLWWLKVYCRRQ